MNSEKLKAASTKINITPPLGTRINGDFVTHFANYIHDELYARILLLSAEGTTLLFIVLDTCIIPQEFSDNVKRQIEKATGIPFSHILLASTHTHAAGSLADVHLGSKDVDYARSLPSKIVSGVMEVMEKLEPATIGHASFDAPEHVVCRRYFMKEGYVYINPVSGQPDAVKTNPVGASELIDKRTASPDTQLSYLGIRNDAGEWIAILANYSLHYVGDWENGTISADYFGVFASYLEARLDNSGKMTAMMTNGTSGDVNIWDFLNPDRYPTELFAKSRLIGEDLAEKLISSIPHIQWETTPTLQAQYKEVALEVEKPTEEEIAAAGSLVAQTNYETISPDTPEEIRRLYAREQLLINRFPDTITCPVQLFRIGNIAIGALAGEFFAETGLKLKQKSGEKYFTITMANGNIGYVPPKQQLQLGGYETWRCRYRCATEDGETTVRKELETMIG